MTRSIYLFYNSILVQSPSFKEYLLDQRVNENKIIYYPYYAENFYKVVKSKEDVKSLYGDGLNIVFAGNIGVAQSFDTIIDAATIIKKTIANFKFIIIGDGRDKKRVKNRIKKLSISDNFTFLGSYPPSKMSDFFACADVLLVSLKNTKIFSMTIPGKLQSYLACGRPIIGSLNGIGAKIIIDSKSGFVSKSEDSKGLAESIIRFSKLNDSERAQFGQNARQYFLKKNLKKNKTIKKIN